MDKAHITTDKQLATMERKLTAIYSRANKEVGEKLKDYLKSLEPREKELSEAVKAAKSAQEREKAEEAYKSFMTNKTLHSEHFKALSEQYAKELLKVNETAADYINNRMPAVYSLNYNEAGNGIAGQVKGYSFEMVDASTVKSLATKDETLLPYKTVNGKKDVRWNTKQVNSEILQGILQGESIPNISKRLTNVTEMNLTSAIRNARTATTSAENRGRMDSYHRAEDMGIKIVKVWMATNDQRTREEHVELDGQEREIDEPFENSLGEIMYPGDPDADPANVYNCRCTMVTKVVGFEKTMEDRDKDVEILVEDTDNNYNAKTLSAQIGYTAPMNEYEYWSEENENKRFDAIKSQTGFSDEKTKETLYAFCGDKNDYRGLEHTPEGWFYGADTRIRDLEGDKWKNAAKTIDDYIISAPKYDGTIYRGLSLDGETISKLKQGGIFEERGSLSSWTSDFDIAQMFAEGRTEQMGLTPVIIETENHPYSSPVAHLSVFGSEENEVIVSNMHGNTYSIENIEEKNGTIFVKLKIGE